MAGSSGGISVEVHIESSETQDALDAIAARVDAAVREFVVSGGLVLEGHMKAHSPSDSGTNRRSIGVHDVSGGAGTWMSKTGPTTPYGRRLDQGFHGADSLGRFYDQAGVFYAQAGIADSMDELAQLHVSMMTAAVNG